MIIEIPEKMAFLFAPARFKVAYGGRAGIKSWSFARALLALARARRLRIGCARETMKSIEDSVHQLLQDQIAALGMGDFFRAQKKVIRALNGSTFTYHGLRDRSVRNIKSLEAVDILWIEEAQNVSKKSWNIVVPTIRKPGSEIWASFNPELETDETYQRLVMHPPAGCTPVKTSYRDNPFLSDEVKKDMADLKARDPLEFEHVYEGVQACCAGRGLQRAADCGRERGAHHAGTVRCFAAGRYVLGPGLRRQCVDLVCAVNRL